MLFRVIVLVAILILLTRTIRLILQERPRDPEIRVNLVGPQSSTNPQPLAMQMAQALTNKTAQIVYNFQGMPVMQVFSIYEDLCGKKIHASPAVNMTTSVQIVTDHPLTTNEAMRLLERELQKQAHVKLEKLDDENLSAVPVSP